MSAVKKDRELPSPVLAVCPSKPEDIPIPYLAVCPPKPKDLPVCPAKPDDLPYLAVCPPNPADLHGSFLEPPPLEVQISPSNLDYHEPPPSPSTELPPKQISELPIDENAPIICICPPAPPLPTEKQ